MNLKEIEEKYKHAFVYLTGEYESVDAADLNWLIAKVKELDKIGCAFRDESNKRGEMNLKLLEENTRLREALKCIACDDGYHSPSIPHNCCIAKAALEGK